MNNNKHRYINHNTIIDIFHVNPNHGIVCIYIGHREGEKRGKFHI